MDLFVNMLKQGQFAEVKGKGRKAEDRRQKNANFFLDLFVMIY
jgi:hypothetical protein